PNVALLLDQNNGFLPPIMKSKNQHYTNPIHALQYYDKLKILSYNCCCPSISQELHQRLCNTACGKYFPTLKYLANHKQSKHCSKHERLPRQMTNYNSAEDVMYSNP
ncbi:11577_t:CDS:1, partial [Dentiscutata erythropus]